VDTLVGHSRIDAQRIGVLGRSLGGNYAVQSAAMDERLAACAAWGAMVDMSYWSDMDPATQRGFAYVAGYGPDRLAEAGRFLNAALELRPVLSRVRCPVYIQHGELDQVIPVSQVQPLTDGLVNAREVVVDILPGANHCAHNRYHVARPRLVDWMSGRLGGGV
jgi:2,6-dihydroxypseudooxynicotine hydrolase